MDRVLLTHLPVVLAVARTRSFVRAAAELGMSASAVSHAVRLVEDRLGAPLFARTTRSVAVTEAGAAFLDSAGRVVDELDEAVERLRAGQAQVTGLLRINAPRIALYMGFTPLLAELTRRHPQLTVEVVTDDALADVVAEGFDAGVRLGEMIAQDMVAVRFTPPFRAIMVASPDYLSGRSPLRTFADLASCLCIGYRLLRSGAVYAWDLRDGDKDVRMEVASAIRVSDPLYARELAMAGLGVAYVMEPLVQAEIAQGRLVEVLPDASILEPGLFLYFPRHASRTAKLRVLVELLQESNIARRSPGSANA
jgi:DNA-binding transcriptional LysR family regulator